MTKATKTTPGGLDGKTKAIKAHKSVRETRFSRAYSIHEQNTLQFGNVSKRFAVCFFGKYFMSQWLQHNRTLYSQRNINLLWEFLTVQISIFCPLSEYWVVLKSKCKNIIFLFITLQIFCASKKYINTFKKCIKKKVYSNTEWHSFMFQKITTQYYLKTFIGYVLYIFTVYNINV